ncbi:PREDICTED: uncharacterized protein CXorf67-like [Dipodomys ordii]|uniref:Uncharacterized protein CXorf67-like n=1 Tax=Dipodomys ordii TaxID=10020 RepID=A0A1S3G5G6_DIPOR|nr:PREDICTED: uncharacterized protein CXorf67-like [Dipodomys ordii]
MCHKNTKKSGFLKNVPKSWRQTNSLLDKVNCGPLPQNHKPVIPVIQRQKEIANLRNGTPEGAARGGEQEGVRTGPGPHRPERRTHPGPRLRGAAPEAAGFRLPQYLENGPKTSRVAGGHHGLPVSRTTPLLPPRRWPLRVRRGGIPMSVAATTGAWPCPRAEVNTRTGEPVWRSGAAAGPGPLPSGRARDPGPPAPAARSRTNRAPPHGVDAGRGPEGWRSASRLENHGGTEVRAARGNRKSGLRESRGRSEAGLKERETGWRRVTTCPVSLRDRAGQTTCPDSLRGRAAHTMGPVSLRGGRRTRGGGVEPE